ncbi:hypothetical protein Ndes2526B_g04905 [Nannochloris sp. 'desiccata']
MAAAGEIPAPSVPAPPRPGGLASRDATQYPTASERYATGAPAGASQYEETRTSGTRMHMGGGLHIPGASSLYSILGLLLLLAGILCLVMPYRLTDIFFRGERKYYDVIFEELWRILAATLFSAAITAYALKVSSDRRVLNDPVVQRLQLGFFWFALLAVAIHLIHVLFIKSLTLWGLLLGATIMAPTLLLPTAHLGMSGGFGLAVAADSVSDALGNVFAPRRVTFSGVLYSLLTVLFAVVGLGYIILPKLTLKWALGYHAGKRAIFLWQWIGSGMLFLFPAITYTCLERGIQGALWGTVPKTLNVALLVASLFHILEFGSVLSTEGISGRWLLPVSLGHWVATLLASILGLSAEEPTAAYEYEPLRGEPAMV